MKSWAKGFYASDAWHRARQSYISYRSGIDGGMCEVCHEKPGYIVHHIKELTPNNINDPNITLSENNLEYVCKDCHDKIHGYCGRSEPDERRTVIFDRDGNPIRVRSPRKNS